MLLGGVSAGMVLFIVSVGLSVTMGLMGFVNLAHGGFAMIGGYVIAVTMRQWGIGFLPALALGFLITALVSVVFERLFYSRLYRSSELDQVLFTIGLVFVMIASVTLRIGPENQSLTLPPALQGQLALGFFTYRTYTIFWIAVGVLMVTGLWSGFEPTRMGAQIRAAVDNRRMAESLGINISRLFTITFAFGSGMAALGGGLGVEFLGLDPQYPLKYLGLFLIVVQACRAALPHRRAPSRPVLRRVLCGAGHRRPRLRAQAVSPAGRHRVHLRAHHPAAALAAAGPVRGQPQMSAPTLSATEHPAALALARRSRLRPWEALP